MRLHIFFLCTHFITLFFITDMFLFIHDCFRHKSHGRCYSPLEMIFIGDFVVLAKATGESVQDMTLLLFFFSIL